VARGDGGFPRREVPPLLVLASHAAQDPLGRGDYLNARTKERGSY
jgi:hypothetical protein